MQDPAVLGSWASDTLHVRPLITEWHAPVWDHTRLDKTYVFKLRADASASPLVSDILSENTRTLDSGKLSGAHLIVGAARVDVALQDCVESVYIPQLMRFVITHVGPMFENAVMLCAMANGLELQMVHGLRPLQGGSARFTERKARMPFPVYPASSFKR